MIALIAALAMAQTTSGPGAPGGIAEPNEGAGVPFKCSPTPIPGTVSADVVRQARATNAQFYGASNFAERVLFPRLENRRNGTAFEVNVINGVAMVPSRYRGSGCAEDSFEYLNSRVDLQSAAVGWAFSVGPVQIFSATSVASHTYADALAPVKYLETTAVAIGLGYLGPAAMLFKDKDEPSESRSIDYLIGAQGGLPKIAYARVAYVGSRGFYTEANGTLVRLFGALGAKPTGLPYLRAGLDQQPWGEDEEGKKPATSLFVRKMEFRPPSGLSEQAEDLWTGHLRQTNLGGLVDLRLAYAWAPVPLLHEAKVGLHTPGFNGAKKAIDVGENELFANLIAEEAGILEAALTAGVVQLPDLTYYGVEGKQAVSWDLEVLAAFASEDLQGFVSFKVGANDADTLAIFPYAYDAIHYNLNVGIGFD